MTGGRTGLAGRPNGYAHEGFDSGQQVFNVMHHSAPAMGDGRVDAHEAINYWLRRASALAGGGTVFLPPGTYPVRQALSVPSNVTLAGAGPATVVTAGDNFNGTLVTFASGVAYAALRNLTLDGNSAHQSTSGTLVAVLGTASHITIGGDVLLSDPKTTAVAVSASATDITVGDAAGAVDARVFGARGDALRMSDAAMTSGDNLLTSATGGFTSAMAGRIVEVVGAGTADGASGFRNLVGYVGSVPGATTLRIVTTSGGSTALNATSTVSARRAVVAVDDWTRMQEAANAAANAAAKSVRVPAGSYFLSAPLAVGSNTFLVGDGPGVTFLRAATGVTPVTLTSVTDAGLSDMTIEGFGTDGTATGLSFQSCLQVKDSTHVYLSRLHCRFGQNGILIRDQSSTLVFLDDILISSITTSNGTTGGTGGIGLWLFNGVSYVTGSNINITQTGRHGLMLDAGTTLATGATEHGHLFHCAFGDVVITNAGFGGATGAALVLNGARSCTFSDFSINTTGAACDAVSISGDQNGEYSQDNVLTGFTCRAIGARALEIASSSRNTIMGMRVYDYNTAQSASYTSPIYIGGDTNFNAAMTTAAPDTTDNTIIGFELEYLGALANKFTYGVTFQGGQSGPDGASGTRTMQTLRNQVLKSRFRTPQTGPVVYAGGADCPSVGSGANVAWDHNPRVTSGSMVWSTLVDGDADMRLQVLNSGKLQWGDGTNAPDASLLRFTTGTLEVDNKLLVRGANADATGLLLSVLAQGDGAQFFQARADRKLYLGDGTTTDVTLHRSGVATATLTGGLAVSGGFAANGASPAARPTYTATNVSTDRSYDANATTTDELADVLGTLLADLRAMGLIS